MRQFLILSYGAFCWLCAVSQAAFLQSRAELSSSAGSMPAPPQPEPIQLTDLPFPPTAPSDDEGACSVDINPRRTGCVSITPKLMGVSFMPDGAHVVTAMLFAGAPAAPDPASIYTGEQLVIIKADGTTFENGDAWKCITCGMLEEHSIGRGEYFDYPQAFRDGKRVLAGTDIVSCGEYKLTDPECNPEETRTHPVRWNVQPDGSGAGGAIRELRLNPDDVHLAWSSLSFATGSLNQHVFIGRLEFDPSPTSGLPLVPRYDLTHVNLLVDPEGNPQHIIKGNKLYINNNIIGIGEGRGFSGDGLEITYIGPPRESCNIDVFAIHLVTGKICRLTAHPEYVDPVDISPDSQWHVVEDTRGTGRQMFLAGMRNIPPLIDIVANAAVSSTRNNGERRFFQPWLLDRYGDRGTYFGQELNRASEGTPGSGALDDPEWNARADPKWSLDGTRIVYFQRQTVSPECGGLNPLPCYPSTDPGGRIDRIVVANLTKRSPLPLQTVSPIPDVIPWAQPYILGMELPPPALVPGGKYELKGLKSGTAKVTITEDSSGTSVVAVSVKYNHYSDDGLSYLDGHESASVTRPTASLNLIHWVSDIVQTGAVKGTKRTSPGGFDLSIDVLTNIFIANGTLTTTINGISYYQPANGT